MKSLHSYIIEKLKIDKSSIKDDIKYNFKNYKDGLEELTELANQDNLIIKFREYKSRNHSGDDFTIFIYDKNVRKSYLVGFDGSWNESHYNFHYCYEQAKGWIEKYINDESFRNNYK